MRKVFKPVTIQYLHTEIMSPESDYSLFSDNDDDNDN